MNDRIPFLDFGGDGPLLHFAHANAYPPGCYEQFIEALTPHYHVIAMEQRPLWDNANLSDLTSWNMLADDLIRFFDQQGIRNVIGMGHSLGAVVTMWAALQRPSLFRDLVFIEPVFLTLPLLQLLKANPGAASLTPLVRMTRRRQTHWDSRREAFTYFRIKPEFKRWSDDVLQTYVENGLREKESGGFTLIYSREWEAEIYTMPPLTIWEDIPRIVHPTLAVRGVDTDTVFPDAWAMWQEAQPTAAFVEVDSAGHMIPMERPFFLADIIHKQLKAGEKKPLSQQD